ncbi:hypothetical protein [Ancylobacter oerskovii]|uniref:SGNH/GDSL hydrolase family protein n=1 Tax=Ancylobacter oerskovii TaxID=459519 RepID=A0ABW4YTA1_9HYPH|nr:hypothetical protein [Ancylobacter oerskovii]MBS7543367.1 hypothetical protein [Ancylobacter oerskovii]
MKQIIGLGDSHLQYFSFAATNGLLSPYQFHACRVPGATAAGLMNEKSATDARGSFLNFLKEYDKTSLVLLHLGEVDCGILVWLRAQKNGTSLEHEVSRSIESYMRFVDELVAGGRKNVAITSATLPTINDHDHSGDIISIRRQAVSATQKQRTEVTHLFNAQLAREAAARGLTFIDAQAEVVDRATGMVSTRFRNRNAADHHMDNVQAGVMWASLLNRKLRFPRQGAASHFVAKEDTLLKSLPLRSSKLTGDHYVLCKKGTAIRGRLVGSLNGCAIFREVSSPDVAVADLHRVAYQPHWEQVTAAGRKTARKRAADVAQASA